jgi:AcrR family transcriptional regulator
MEFIMIEQSQLFTEAMNLYGDRGVKFTMDELASRLCISKKTLYEMVRSKEDLFIQVIEFYFQGVADLQNTIHSDSNLSAIDKLKKLLCATPDFVIRKVHLHELKMNYPDAFKILDDKLRHGWDKTLYVLDQAKAEGMVREIDNHLFSKIYASAIEEVILSNDNETLLTFRQQQQQIVDLLLFGICK